LRSISEFDLIHLARTNQRELCEALIRHAWNMRRPVVRVFTRCSNLFPLHGDMPGYDSAWDFVRDTCRANGVYFSPVIFVDNYPENGNIPTLDHGGQDAWFERLTTRPDVGDPVYLWSIVNEPEQKWQGFDGATDPRLFRYADTLAARLGHRDFIIGAAPDGDDRDASAQTIKESREIARFCNLIALHSSRKGGYFPQPDGRMRRWVDHLESMVDIIDECRKINNRAYGYHEEPPGHASREDVPIPGGVYHREWDAECAVAGAITAETCGLGYCYHRIRHQDDGTPGLQEIANIMADFPAGWDYRNDSWGGSPSHGFTDANGNPVEGKVRHAIGGNHEARTLAYAQSGVPVIEWANGYSPEDPPLYRGPRVYVTKS
jgi:hypothetical protein